MRLLNLFLFSVLFSSACQAQTPAEINAQLRSELVTVKAKSEELKPAFDKLYLSFNAYSDSLLLRFKAIPMNQLIDSRIKFIAYEDSIECINRDYSKTVPFKDLLNDERFIPARDKYMPCMNALNEVLNVKYNVNYRPRYVVLGEKAVAEENEDLKESIESYVIKNERMLAFLSEVQSGFTQGASVESSIDYLKAAYDRELAEVNDYTAVLKDTVAQARKRYRTNPQNSKYKYCFESPEPFSGSQPKLPPPPPVIIDVVEESAEFIGGMAAMKEYLAKNLVYPESAKKKEIEGKVYLRFVISETGNVSNVTVKKGVPDCPDCDKEAVRVVKNMPDWKPAKNGGKTVNSWYTLPITFKLPD